VRRPATRAELANRSLDGCVRVETIAPESDAILVKAPIGFVESLLRIDLPLARFGTTSPENWKFAPVTTSGSKDLLFARPLAEVVRARRVYSSRISQILTQMGQDSPIKKSFYSSMLISLIKSTYNSASHLN
jgi:hypothetical protein